jgi:hypothetical protein
MQTRRPFIHTSVASACSTPPLAFDDDLVAALPVIPTHIIIHLRSTTLQRQEKKS